MADSRIEKLAQVLVRYCLDLQPGKEVQINSTYLAEPLIREVYRECLRAGAYPTTRIGISGLGPMFYRLASDDQIKHVSEIERFEVEKIDATIGIMAAWNTKGGSGLDPKKLALANSSHHELMERMMEREVKGEFKWVGTQFPTNASAQDAEMALDDYEDFVYGAMLLDKPDPAAEWKRVSGEQERLVKYLNEVQAVEVRARDTHLKFRCAGRKWINCDGKVNFPDGEVFTGPIEDSVEGEIRFTFPAIYMGREVIDVRLRFEHGKVVEAHAAKGEDLLLATIDTDPGARFVGEVALGTNYGIQRFTKNILFDEKIGGTMHMALGASLPESGGVNKSVVHWDMLCDLREGGEVLADGKLIHKDGKFLI
jgi:aminopeptidase